MVARGGQLAALRASGGRRMRRAVAHHDGMWRRRRPRMAGTGEISGVSGLGRA
jgi:hypothetical protein